MKMKNQLIIRTFRHFAFVEMLKSEDDQWSSNQRNSEIMLNGRSPPPSMR